MVKPDKSGAAYAYSDHEVVAVNSARNKRDGYECLDETSGILVHFDEESEKCFLSPQENMIVVEIPPFWLHEGIEHFSDILFSPQLERVKEAFEKNDVLKQVKFIFPYRLVDSWHWNAAEIVFSKDEEGGWQAQGAKYDPFGYKDALEDKIVGAAIVKFEEDFLDSDGEVVKLKVDQIKFIKGQEGGVACGMYSAFVMHKLKTQNFTTKEELDDEECGIWAGLAESEEEQRQEDLNLVDEYEPEAYAKFGQISDTGFVNSRKYLPSKSVKKKEDELDFVDLGVTDELSHDAFSYQVNRHYRGLLEKINSIKEESLNDILVQISEVVNGLEGDDLVLETEKEIQRKIAITLKRYLLSKMALNIIGKLSSSSLPEEGEEDEVELEDVVNLVDESFFEGNAEIQKYLEEKQDIYDWEEMIDYHLDLYGKKLIEIERESKIKIRAEELDYPEQQEESDDDLNAMEWDYGDFDESEKSSVSEEEYFDDEREFDVDTLDSESDEEWFYLSHEREFSNPSTLGNLIAICSGFGEEPLSWLTNQVVEYDHEDLWEAIIQNILADDKCAELDRDLLEFIIYGASVFSGDDELTHMLSSGSMARDYDDKKLVSGGFVMGALKKYLSEINKKRLSDGVEKQFAYVKEINDKGWLKKLREDYNLAASRNDLVTQNQLWSIFDLLQKRLKQSKFQQDKSSEDVSKILSKAKEDYSKRADEYYFRIYPQPVTNRLIYSSKTRKKVAIIEMDKILGEMETIGEQIKDILFDKTSAKKKDTTNVLVPVLCFVVSDRTHKDKKSKRDHKRVIIPISCNFDVPNYLLSKDESDGVVTKSDEEFFDQAKKDSKDGMEKVRVKSKLARQNPEPTTQNNELLAHSERVMFEAFRDESNVEEIVKILYYELRQISPEEDDVLGRFKVYSVALLLYSTNSVCQLCSPAVIAHENHLHDSFLTLLIKKLRDFEIKDGDKSSKAFKIRGEVSKSCLDVEDEETMEEEEVKRKFHLTTIVTSGKPFTIQSEDMHGVGKKAELQNPQSRIYLEGDAIDLHRHEKDKEGNPISDHHSFYEFSQSDFKKSLEEKKCTVPVETSAFEGGMNFKFVGKTFMSGSKESKTSSKKRKELDKEVKTVVETREVLKLSRLEHEKEKFITR